MNRKIQVYAYLRMSWKNKILIREYASESQWCIFSEEVGKGHETTENTMVMGRILFVRPQMHN